MYYDVLLRENLTPISGARKECSGSYSARESEHNFAM